MKREKFDYEHKIDLRYLGENCWAVLTPIKYKDIEVPEYFVCDLASVPRILWFVFPPFGEYIRAAIVHDYLYEQAELSAEEIHEIFAEIMVEDEVDEITQFFFNIGVNLFGPKLKKRKPIQ